MTKTGSPSRLRGEFGPPISGRAVLAGATAVLAVCALAIAYADRPTALYFQTRGAWTNLIFEVVTVLGVSTIYIGIAVAICAGSWLAARRIGAGAGAERHRRQVHRAMFFLACLLTPAITVDLLKFLIGRPRPRLLFRYELFGFDPPSMDPSFWSFPSGHASTAAAVAFALGLLYPRFRLAYIAVAALIIISRVVLAEHFISDVVFGASWGLVLAATGARLFQKWRPDWDLR